MPVLPFEKSHIGYSRNEKNKGYGNNVGSLRENKQQGNNASCLRKNGLTLQMLRATHRLFADRANQDQTA